MKRGRRRAKKLRPAPLKSRAALQQASSYCIACGSRYVVEFHQRTRASAGGGGGGSGPRGDRLIKCQSCGVIAPDMNQPKPRRGTQEDFVPLERPIVHEMADQVLDAFTHQRTKRKLQQALDYAQGDLALICHKYLPLAIDVFAHVVSRFGFTATMDGMAESVRVLQTHAKDDESLVCKLIRIRKLLTPTAEWIQEDVEAEHEDERRKELEQQSMLLKQEEERREELLAAESAKKARLRAKKIAMGLDPSVERLPLLLDVPPPVIAAREGARLELRLNAKYVQTFRWFFNGRLLETEELVTGIRRSTLVVLKLSKRVAGEYYCECENEEGTVTSPSCRVGLAMLRSARLGSRKLGALASSPLRSFERGALITCVANTVSLFDAKSLATVKLRPSALNDKQTLAWDPQSKLLVVASAVAKQQDSELFLYSLEFPNTDTNSVSASRSVAGSDRGNSNASALGLPTKPKAAVSSASPQIQLMDLHTIDDVVEVRAVEFLAHGSYLILTDMKHRVALYDLLPSLTWRKTLVFERDFICHLAVHPRAPTLFCLSFRNKPFVSLYHNATRSDNNGNGKDKSGKGVDSWIPSAHELDFKFPVHCTAFDTLGGFLAVAESGFMKSWVSIINIQTKKPSRRRFVAHVGKVSALQWTNRSSLLLTSGHDGYVKVWDPVAGANLFSVHLDERGVHSMLLAEEHAVLLALGCTDCRLQSRSMIQLAELETSRLVEMNEHATTIQKLWKGKRTRELIAKYIKVSE